MEKIVERQDHWINNRISIFLDVLAPPILSVVILFLSVFLTAILSYIISRIFVFNWGALRVDVERHLDNGIAANLVFVVLYLIMTAVILVNRRRFKERFFDYVAGGRASVVVLSVVAGVVVGGVSLVLTLLGHAAGTSSRGATGSIDFGIFDKTSVSHLASMTILIMKVSFIGPVAEELYFRRIIYIKLRETLNVKFSVFVSGLIFVIAHLYKLNDIETPHLILSCIAIFFVGALCSIFLEISKSILPSIYIHVLNNSIIILPLFF